jgi:hypothetical protein
MLTKQKSSQISVLLVLWLAFCQSIIIQPTAAQEDAQERDIEAKEVLQSRRQSKNPKRGKSYRYRVRQSTTLDQIAQDGNRKPSDSLVSKTPKSATNTAAQQFPFGPPPKGTTYTTIGVTLWRVRLATEAESKDPKVSKERMIWGQQEREVVVTRISDDSPISDQDFIQMSIEYLPDRNGAGAEPENRAVYLYVINQEEFSDGSLKNARLIFPTQLTYGGDNRVLPGKIVTLPDPSRPFRITRGNSGTAQAYETYSIILSPAPLDSELPQEIRRKAMEISPDLVTRWGRQWGEGEVRADLQGGVGQARTQRELGANGDTRETRSTVDSDEDLTQDDAPPQIIFRRAVKPGSTMLVTVKLPIK